MRIPFSYLFIVSAAGYSLIGCSKSAVPTPVAVESGTVTLEFVLRDERQRVIIPDIRGGASLESVLRQVTDPEIQIRGSGTTAFVESIGGQQTGASEGWTFRVDDQWSSQGIGKTVLSPPTTVTWTYGAMEE